MIFLGTFKKMLGSNKLLSLPNHSAPIFCNKFDFHALIVDAEMLSVH